MRPPHRTHAISPRRRLISKRPRVLAVIPEEHSKHCVRNGIGHGDADKTLESFAKAVERFANMQ